MPKHSVILYYCEHTAAIDHNSGIQRVTRMTAKGLLENGIKLVPVKYNHNDSSPELVLLSRQELANLSKWNGPSVGSWPSREELEVIFDKATALVVPELVTYQNRTVLKNIADIAHKKNMKMATVFHDAIPLMYPDWYDPASFITFCDGIKYSDVILPVSNSSANDLIRLVLDEDFDKSRVVVSSLPTEMPELSALPINKSNSNTVKMLFVSNFDKRKNHIFLLQAFKRARDILAHRGIDLKLTMVGALSFFKDYQKQLSRMSIQLGVEIIVNCSDEMLARKYQESDFTVYPSLYEGYGLPVVESLALGRPVISSTGGSLVEVAKNGCVTFDPDDIDRFINLIVILAGNRDFREKLTKDISNREIKTWSQYAAQIVKALS